MGKYFVSAIDYGPDNGKYPRYDVRTYGGREPWGHLTNRHVSGPYWTDDEALAEIARLEHEDTISSVIASIALIIALILAILALRVAL